MRGDEQGMGHSGVDARLEAALRSYAEPGEMAEARVAVARILERARTEPDARRSWWSWRVGVAVAGACVAAMVLVMAGSWLRMERVPEIAWKPATPAAVAEAQPVASLERPARLTHAVAKRAGRDQRHEGPLPKLGVFPSPAPLTAGEQALVRFAATAPPTARKQLVEAEKPWNEPIAIAELKIRPLDAGENQEAEGKAERENP